jgi:hypothetical protein
MRMTADEQAKHTDASDKPYRLWHVSGQNEFVAVVADADTFDEIRQVRRRSDWRYQITCNGAPVDEKTGYPILRLPGQDLTLQD